MRRTNLRSPCIALAAAGLSAVLASPAAAQNRDAPQRPGAPGGSTGQNAITLPGSERMIELRVASPDQIRVGKSYDYEIQVSNLTRDVMLHDVKIAQKSEEGFEIESSRVERAQERNARDGEDRGNGENSRDNGDRDNGDDQEQADGRDADHDSKTSGRWTISELKPGETRTIRVSATSDEEGANKTCVSVTSFTPALCVTTEFVKPDLELVKQAPDKVDLCEPIQFEYYVKNSGTGPTGEFQIRDELDDGLRTAAGNETLEFTVDELRPGETKKFVAEIVAREAGQYSSRAVAEKDDEQQARSKSVETEVRQADLAIQIDGPETQYYDRPITYTIRVTNRGNAPAPDARLDLYAPEESQLVRAGDPRESDERAGGSGDRAGRQPTLVGFRGGEDADRPGRAQGDDQENRSRERPEGDRAHSWGLGTLEPDQTRKVNVTLRGQEAGTLKHTAVAQYICARGQDEETTVRTTAFAETEIISLPALLVAVVDQEDPIRVGGEVVYRIVVQNQGTAADRDVKITARLPEELEFVEASGETEAEADGREVTFGAIDELKPGDRATWTLRAKARGEGDIRFSVGLTSEHQKKEVESEEPTRLFRASQQD